MFLLSYSAFRKIRSCSLCRVPRNYRGDFGENIFFAGRSITRVYPGFPSLKKSAVAIPQVDTMKEQEQQRQRTSHGQCVVQRPARFCIFRGFLLNLIKARGVIFEKRSCALPTDRQNHGDVSEKASLSSSWKCTRPR